MRFAASYRDDDGWFENDAPGVAPLGAVTGWVLRSVLTWQPSAHCDITAMFADCGRVKSADVAVSDGGLFPNVQAHAVVDSEWTSQVPLRHRFGGAQESG